MRWSTQNLLPLITLKSFSKSNVSEDWEPKHDLLNSDPGKKEFVVEVETNGTAYLHFRR